MMTLGQTQQFIAAVTGRVDTTVVWLSTSGSIDQQGLYQVSVTGIFQVMATSNADPTKCAIAIVNVIL